MKKISFILAVVFIFTILLGCVACDPSLPRYSELRNIEIGMNRKDFIDKYGDSKNRTGVIEIGEEIVYNFYYVYDTFEGKQIGIRYDSQSEMSPLFVAEVIDIEPVKKSELPTYEKLSQIKAGMLTKDVISEYGQAQRIIEKRNRPSRPEVSLTTSFDWWVYDSCDGMSVGILYHGNQVLGVTTLSPDDSGGDFLEE